MKTDLDIDAFLHAARSPEPDVEARRAEARDRLEIVLGPLAALGTSSAPTTAATAPSPSGIARHFARYKAYVFLAGGAAIGWSTHAVVDAAKSRGVAESQLHAASVASAKAPAASASATNDVPARDVESLPIAPLPSARAATSSSASSARDDRHEQGHDKRDLAAESVLLETARTALERGEPEHAMTALDRHRQNFPDGQLSEERESLTIYALVAEGKTDEARAKTAVFHQVFPSSLQGPALDALTAPSP